MAAKYPADPSSPAAIDGTHTHTALEYCLTNAVVDAHTLEGTEMEDHEGTFTIDKGRADRIQVALDYVYRRMNDLALRGYWPQLHIERFVDTGKRFNIPRWGGSQDIALTWTEGTRKCVESIDYKDGAKAVDPKTFQLVTYTAGLANELNGGNDFDDITVTIIQPKVSAEPKSHRYTKMQFVDKLGELAVSMRESCNSDAPREAGEWCTFCPGAKMGRCPEWQADAKGALDNLFMQPNMPPPLEGELLPAEVQNAPAMPFQFPEIGEETSDEQLESILDAEDIILGLLKEAKAEALRRQQEGKAEFHNWTLGETKTHRKFVKGALDALKKMKLRKEVYLEEKLKTPKQLLATDAFKALSDNRKEAIKNLIEKPPGKPTLVPKSTALEDQTNLLSGIPQLPEEV
jgi:hypothetical protein